MNIGSLWAGSARHAADGLSVGYVRPPIPVLEVAERCGVEVLIGDFGKFRDTLSGFCNFDKARLFVNKDDDVIRQFFTIAHELGHWVLHKPNFEKSPGDYPVLPRYHDPDRADPLEKEANIFAMHLLVPERLLRQVRNASAADLAEAFGVSENMMAFRLKYE